MLNHYGFDCGTTNWRFYQLNEGDRSQSPQPVSLTICDPARHFLSAALLVDGNDQILACGERAYQEIQVSGQLLNAFKPCFGNYESVQVSDANKRYTHEQSLGYTEKLLAQVVKQLQIEKPNCLTNNNQFVFTHPVHWGKVQNNGEIEGQIIQDFALKIRGCFPEFLQNNIHFVPEPEAALISLVQTKQLQEITTKFTLILDIGGGTTDIIAGKWTGEGLQDIRYFGLSYGGNNFDQNLANFIADKFKLDESQRLFFDQQLRYYGRKFKEYLSQQAQTNFNLPINLSVVLIPQNENQVIHQSLGLNCAEFVQLTKDGKEYLHNSLLVSLEKMQLTTENIGQIMLVGGGARLFIISDILREIFGDSVPIIYSDPPESTVARGAALWGMRSSLLSQITVYQPSQLVVTSLPETSEVTINILPENYSMQTLPKEEKNMSDNAQIRQEMEQVQNELQTALKDILILAKKELKPEQIKEIEAEFQEINELLERIKTGLVHIGLFGKIAKTR